jgi:hypothetical protein
VLDTESYRFLQYDCFWCSHFFLFPRTENMFVSQSHKSHYNAFEKLHNLYPKIRGEFFFYKEVKTKIVVTDFIQMAVNRLVFFFGRRIFIVLQF